MRFTPPVLGLTVLTLVGCGETPEETGGTTNQKEDRRAMDAGEPAPTASDAAGEFAPPPEGAPDAGAEPEPTSSLDVPTDPSGPVEPTAPNGRDAGTGPSPDASMTPAPPVPSPEPAADGDVSLLYIASSPPKVVNVRDGSVWAELALEAPSENNAVPWSRDGSTLVDGNGEAVVFLSRGQQGFVEGSTVAIDGYPQRWLGNEGVLVSTLFDPTLSPESPFSQGLWLVRPNGESDLVRPAQGLGTVRAIATSPDGTQLILESDLEGMSAVSRVSFEGGVPGEVQNISSGEFSQIASWQWSPDGRFFVFEMSTSNGWGIFSFDVAGETTTRLTPEGPGDDRLFSFAGDTNLLALYTGTQEPELGIVKLDQGTTWQTVQTGPSSAPFEWSPDGTTLLHGAAPDTMLVPLESDGALSTPVPFTEGCPLLWISGSEFYYSCAGDGLLWRGLLDGSTLVTESVREGVLPTFTRSPSGRCAVNSSPTEIAYVSLISGYQEVARFPASAPTLFTFPKDESGVAFVESSDIHWQAMDDECNPTESTRIPDAGSVSSIAFLP